MRDLDKPHNFPHELVNKDDKVLFYFLLFKSIFIVVLSIVAHRTITLLLFIISDRNLYSAQEELFSAEK